MGWNVTITAPNGEEQYGSVRYENAVSFEMRLGINSAMDNNTATVAAFDLLVVLAEQARNIQFVSGNGFIVWLSLAKWVSDYLVEHHEASRDDVLLFRVKATS